MCVCAHSAISDSAIPWTVALQALLSMGLSRWKHQSGLPFPPAGDLPDPDIQAASPVVHPLAGRFFTTEPSGKLSNR